MKKRATRKPASRKSPRARTAAKKATAKKATAKKAGPSQTVTPSKGSGRYTPREVRGTGWAPFRYPPQ